MSTTVNADNKAAGKRRRRRSPAEARQQAIVAAREILRNSGPASVTLQSVAKASGMAHGNITHHFGTSSALHAALIGDLAYALGPDVTEAVAKMRRLEVEAEAVVEIVFSVFRDSGCGQLIGWLAGTNDQDALAPIFKVIADTVELLRSEEPATADPEKSGAGPMALEVISLALAASLVGRQIEMSSGMAEGSLRRVAADRIRALRALEAN